MSYSAFQYQDAGQVKLSKAGHPDFHLWVFSDSYNRVLRGRGMKHAHEVGGSAGRSYRRCIAMGVTKEELLAILAGRS